MLVLLVCTRVLLDGIHSCVTCMYSGCVSRMGFLFFFVLISSIFLSSAAKNHHKILKEQQNLVTVNF